MGSETPNLEVWVAPGFRGFGRRPTEVQFLIQISTLEPFDSPPAGAVEESAAFWMQAGAFLSNGPSARLMVSPLSQGCGAGLYFLASPLWKWLPTSVIVLP